MGYNILFFPWRDWNQMKIDGFRTREANILVSMLNNPKIDKIICINRSKIPPYIKSILALKNGEGKNRQVEKDKIEKYMDNEKGIYKRRFSNLKSITEKLYILDIDYHIPNPRGNKLERLEFFQRILEKEIQEVLQTLNFGDYITWCFDLTRIEIAGKFKKKVMIFDAIDNLLEHNQKKNDTKYLSRLYNYANVNSELIFTVSKELKQTIFNNHENSYYIPNAINLETYKQKVYTRPSDLPLHMPIVGYVGLLQERIDLEILEYSIQNNKSINFVFIGPILTKAYFKRIKKYQNVYFLGSKHHSEIPTYLHYFDVCIIPHKVNKFTKSMNPLKLYEYLAVGKEVITTSVPPSEDYQHVIHISNDKEGYSQQINRTINYPFEKFKKEDIYEAIKSEDWSQRLKEMVNLLDKMVNR